MSAIQFKTELEELGFFVLIPRPHTVEFEYEVPVGKNKGKKVMLAFEGIQSYPMNCPHGPHFKSKCIQGWEQPTQGIHNSNFGSDYVHWSRPFKNWNNGDRTVKRYLSHIRFLLDKL